MRYLFALLMLLTTSVSYGHEGMIHAGSEIPDYAYQPDTQTVKSGNWFDASVWSNGVPTAAMDAEVMVGHTVVIDSIVYDADFDNDGSVNSTDYLMVKNGHPDADVTGDSVVNDDDFHLFTDIYFGVVVSVPPQDAVVDDLKISGKLSRSRTENTKLVVKTLTNLGGELDYGTAESPILAKCETVFRDQVIDTNYDPSQWGHGLIQVSGKIHCYGVRNTSFLRLSVPALAGQTTLTLVSNPVNWNVGEQLYVPDTSGSIASTFAQAETVTISAINGNVVTLSAPLAFNHNNTTSADLPHVALLNDNIIFRSENPNGTRGHIVHLGRSEVDMHDYMLDGMGRTRVDQLDLTYIVNGEVLHVGTNEIGRYALHMHHFTGPLNYPGPQFTLSHGVVKNNKKWGLVVHNSSHGMVSDNVVVFADGACLVCENGNEYGNSFLRNFCAYTKGSGLGVQGRGSGSGGGDPHVIGDGTLENPYRTDGDQGHEGAVFWVRSMSNNVQDNVFVNGRSGYTAWCRFQANQQIPLYKGAEVHSQVSSAPPGQQFAFVIDNNEIYGNPSAMHLLGLDYGCLMTSNNMWKNPRGPLFDYSSTILLDGGKIVGTNLSGELGVDAGFASYLLKNLDIINWQKGIFITNGTTVDNCYFACTNTDIAIEHNKSPGMRINLNNLQFSNTTNNITYSWKPESVARVYNIPTYVFVRNYNRVVGDDFQLFHTQQEPNFIWNAPASSSGRTRYAPEMGKTNQYLWDTYRSPIAGRLMPVGAVAREGINGAKAAPFDDVAAPVISNLAVVRTSTTATITWTTDEPCASQLEYKMGPAEMTAEKFYTMNPVDSAMKTSHQVVLTGLTPNTKYYYIVRVFDAASNQGHKSLNISAKKFSQTPNFTTLAP